MGEALFAPGLNWGLEEAVRQGCRARDGLRSDMHGVRACTTMADMAGVLTGMHAMETLSRGVSMVRLRFQNREELRMCEESA